MSSLLYFILGMVTVIFVMPLLDSFASTIATLLEIPKSKAAVIVAKNNEEVTNSMSNTEPDAKMPIGFAIPEEEDEEGNEGEIYDK